MVRLTRIYTKAGDAGRTRLGDMSEADKHDPRVESYGTVDEANAAIGLAVCALCACPIAGIRRNSSRCAWWPDKPTGWSARSTP